MHEVIMPRLGNTVESVTIVKWCKEVGEAVGIGETLCEVETDKSTMEVEAKEAGILLARLFDVGDEVSVLSRFAVLGGEGEDVSTLPASTAPSVRVNEAADAERQLSNANSGAPGASILPRVSDALNASTEPGISDAPGATHQVNEGAHSGISPRAWRLAMSAGLSPRGFSDSTGHSISGTGPGGRIIERDVKRALVKSQGTDTADTSGFQAVSSASPPARDPFPGSNKEPIAHEKNAQNEFPGAIEIIPVEGARKTIASRMRASLSGSAQLTINSSAPVDSILTWRQSLKNAAIGRLDVSINHLLMLCVSRLLPHYPELNATFHGNETRKYANVHLGFTVDTPKGLMTPVIRNANRRGLNSLVAEARRLEDDCKEGHLSPDELAGSTFTITNLGVLGIESFTPVLNASEVAILGIGAITNAPIETEAGIGIEKRIGLFLTIDHQAIDGVPSARFLARLVRVLTKLELVAAI